MNLTILLTGVTGQVGTGLEPLLRSLGKVWALTRNEPDLINSDALRQAVRQLQPDWSVNPAAYTAVDKAESEQQIAYAINRDAVTVIGETARDLKAGVIHFSTDYVFNEHGEDPSTEEDTPSPLGVCGASKLAGDEALTFSGSAHLIFRTSWVYGAKGKNFLRSILNLARQKESLNIVADQHGAPTWANDLARLTVHALRLAEERFPGDPVSARLHPIHTQENSTAAQRPLNSRLDCSKLRNRLDFSMPTWQESAAAVMQRIAAP